MNPEIKNYEFDISVSNIPENEYALVKIEAYYSAGQYKGDKVINYDLHLDSVTHNEKYISEVIDVNKLYGTITLSIKDDKTGLNLSNNIVKNFVLDSSDNVYALSIDYNDFKLTSE